MRRLTSKRSLVFSLLLIASVVLVSLPLWSQRRGAGPSNTPRTVPDIGAQYGVSPTAPPSTSSGASRHHAEDEGPVEFHSETVLIQVPAIVADKSGSHVTGLTRESFQVFENGKEQKIATFEEVQTLHTLLNAPASKDGEFTNVGPIQDKAHTAIIIALDTINTPFLDQAYGRKQLIKFLAEHADASQPVGLVQINGKGLRVIHTITSDPDVLLAALKKVNGEIPALQGVDIDSQAAAVVGVDPSLASQSPGALAAIGMDSSLSALTLQLQQFVLNGDATIIRMQQDHAMEITLRSFLDIASSLSGIPGRKTLIWATGSFPFYMDSYASVPGGYLSLLYERTVKALNDAEVSVYPVDVRGLVSTSPAGDANYAGGLTGPAFAHSVYARGWLQNSTIDTLKDFADMTGGRAFYNSNDVAGGFQRAAEDSAQYYLLGYYLDTKNTKAGWRQLKVKTSKPGSEVRSRAGFFVTNATTNPAVSRQLDVETALASPLESTAIPLTLKFVGTSTEGDKKKVDFNIHLGGGSVYIDETRGNHFDLEFDAVIFKNADGTPAGTFGKVMQGSILAASLDSVKATGVGFHNSMDLAPGQYTVRFVVRDNLTGKLGSVSAPLTVN
jgi:VWFA-related protein